METSNPELAAAQLQMSRTMSKVAVMAKEISSEWNKEDGPQTAISTLVVSLASELDKGNVEFKSLEASAFVHSLMATAMLVLSEGRPVWEEAKPQ